jgi:hypothetical protein
MANIFKFRVTTKVKDTLGLGIGNYAANDTIYLNEKQLNTASIRNAIQQGYVEPMGEDDSQVSDIMLDYYNAVQGFKKNVIPVSTIELVSPKAAAGLVNIQATDLAGDVVLGRRTAIDKIMARWTIASVTSGMPRLLVTAGNAGIVSPTLLTSYTYLTGAYAAATNGSITDTAPITWAANDELIIGYSEKFASVVTDRSAANTVATTATAYYWNGTAWVAFNTTTDHTIEVATKTLSRVAVADKCRIIWWEMPDAWIPGGPAGSGALHTDYCVAIKFSAALTTLAGCSVYPVLDKPLADINLGHSQFAPVAVVEKLGASYLDKTGVAVAWSMNGFTTTDYLWLGFTQPVSGFYVTVTNTNSNNVNAVVTYWNGETWASAAVTDASNGGAGTFAQNGAIALVTIPTDWAPAVATNTTTGFPAANTPATISTDELYWIRYTVDGAMDGSVTAVLTRGVPGLNYWYSYETVEMSYVDANDPIKVIIVEPENTIASLTLNAVMADL